MVCAESLARKRDVALEMVTTSIANVVQTRARRAGWHAFLIKPCPYTELLTVVREVLHVR
jgi:FixJ family two-component response regulator